MIHIIYIWLCIIRHLNLTKTTEKRQKIKQIHNPSIKNCLDDHPEHFILIHIDCNFLVNSSIYSSNYFILTSLTFLLLLLVICSTEFGHMFSSLLTSVLLVIILWFSLILVMDCLYWPSMALTGLMYFSISI